MELLWWFSAIVVMAVGLIGTVLPVVPGTTIILAAAVVHRVLVGPEEGMSWWGLAVLVAFTLISYALDFASSYFGAKYFGATKWGVVGAVIGGIVGLFTGFVTLLILPIVGADRRRVDRRQSSWWTRAKQAGEHCWAISPAWSAN